MPAASVAIVFDCGATNLRVTAIDRKGELLAAASLLNAPVPDPENPAFRIWDVHGIYENLCGLSREVIARCQGAEIAGVTVTTFGVDGTLCDEAGQPLYPVISWQCTRTAPVLESIGKYLSLDELYRVSGVLPFSFNTLFRLIWLQENHPGLVERSRSFLFLPSVLAGFLGGSPVNDITMAGTSMATSLEERTWSPAIFRATGFPLEKMTPPVEPGTITGTVTAAASAATGLPAGTPVVATGHDTQFALFGSGAGVHVPVLSSGTWEILMVRSSTFHTTPEHRMAGITTEFDSRPGLVNIGNQWIASGLLEWVKNTFYRDCEEQVYELMSGEAAGVPPGSRGVRVVPEFSASPLRTNILGLGPDTGRAEICRASLEALAERFRLGKEALEQAGGFRADEIICVGGGSKNRLWNQLRATASGAVLRVTDRSETTALGASCFVHAAAQGCSPEKAREQIEYRFTDYLPGSQACS